MKNKKNKKSETFLDFIARKHPRLLKRAQKFALLNILMGIAAGAYGMFLGFVGGPGLAAAIVQGFGLFAGATQNPALVVFFLGVFAGIAMHATVHHMPDSKRGPRR